MNSVKIKEMHVCALSTRKHRFFVLAERNLLYQKHIKELPRKLRFHMSATMLYWNYNIVKWNLREKYRGKKRIQINVSEVSANVAQECWHDSYSLLQQYFHSSQQVAHLVPCKPL